MIGPLNATINKDLEHQLYKSTLPEALQKVYIQSKDSFPPTHYPLCKDLNLKVSFSTKLSGVVAATALVIALIAPLYFSFALVPIALVAGIYCAIQVGRTHNRQDAQDMGRLDMAHRLQHDINEFGVLLETLHELNQKFTGVKLNNNPTTQEFSLPADGMAQMRACIEQLNVANRTIKDSVNRLFEARLSPESKEKLNTLRNGFKKHNARLRDILNQPTTVKTATAINQYLPLLEGRTFLAMHDIFKLREQAAKEARGL